MLKTRQGRGMPDCQADRRRETADPHLRTFGVGRDPYSRGMFWKGSVNKKGKSASLAPSFLKNQTHRFTSVLGSYVATRLAIFWLILWGNHLLLRKVVPCWTSQQDAAIWTTTWKPTSVSSVQSLSCVWLFATPWTAAHQASASLMPPANMTAYDFMFVGAPAILGKMGRGRGIRERWGILPCFMQLVEKDDSNSWESWNTWDVLLAMRGGCEISRDLNLALERGLSWWKYMKLYVVYVGSNVITGDAKLTRPLTSWLSLGALAWAAPSSSVNVIHVTLGTIILASCPSWAHPRDSLIWKEFAEWRPHILHWVGHFGE